MELRGKTALLTGATGGIGAAVAEALAAAGVRLLVTGRNGVKLEALRNRLPGADHVAVVADLASAAGRAELQQRAKAEGVDLLINNAGVSQLALLTEMDPEQLAATITTNLTVPMLLCRELLPLLAARPDAAIVNIGSILGSIGYAGSTAYCASKFGLRGFTEALRRELADTRVRVLYFAPRATATPINCERVVAMNEALGTAVDQPAQVAQQLVASLRRSGERSRYLGWPERFFVRLNSLFPGLVDRALASQLPTIRRYAGRTAVNANGPNSRPSDSH